MNLSDRLADRLATRLPGRLGERAERGPVVAVVKLHGLITPQPAPLARGVVNLAVVESALTRAFEHDRLRAVALAINSPGGAATQSALVAERIRQLAGKHEVPVIACCEDVAASGGYWLACAADEIYAHRTSLVGSIGVVSRGFGLHELLGRVGVQRRLHTAGEHKARLDPFLPESPQDVVWLQGMQEQLHSMFVDWVRSRRGATLPAEPGEDLFTGEIWTGARALELGLIDGLGTLREVVDKRFPGAELIAVEPRRPLLARLGIGGQAAAVAGTGGWPAVLLAAGARAVLEAVEERADWARFGL
jgi:signal peptide peptidase SppA